MCAEAAAIWCHCHSVEETQAQVGMNRSAQIVGCGSAARPFGRWYCWNKPYWRGGITLLFGQHLFESRRTEHALSEESSRWAGCSAVSDPSGSRWPACQQCKERTERLRGPEGGITCNNILCRRERVRASSKDAGAESKARREEIECSNSRVGCWSGQFSLEEERTSPSRL